MKVLLSGGGTAGHVYPALSVAAKFAAEHDDVTFVGTPDGLEARLVREAGIAFRGLPSKGFDRSRPSSFVSAGFIGFGSMLRALSWLRELSPDVVMGFGGYVSLPVGLAAALRGVPLVLHEQNSVPGLANRVLSRWASAIGVTYEESASLLAGCGNVEVTGNPVRAEVMASSRAAGRSMLGLCEEDLVLLAFGGSQGARHLNQALVGLKDKLLDVGGLRVVQIAGPKEVDSVRRAVGHNARWQVHPYVERMGDAIAAADLLVCRAGATTIAEVTAVGAPAILVPYPYATDDHQTKNAKTLVEHGAAVCVADDRLDSEEFETALFRLLGDAGSRAEMAAASARLARLDASQRLVTMARQAAERRSGHGREL